MIALAIVVVVAFPLFWINLPGWWFVIRSWLLIGIAAIGQALSVTERFDVFQEMHKQWKHRLAFLSSAHAQLHLPRWLRFSWAKFFFLWIICVALIDNVAFFVHLAGRSPDALGVRNAPAHYVGIACGAVSWLCIASCYNIRRPSFPVRTSSPPLLCSLRPNFTK